jgi:tripartite-type tricarboxylate transporter receptor subunit TctC
MKKIFTGFITALCVTGAMAWPDKPVSLVVPFPPGGSTDLIARTLAPKLQERLGGSFIIENKAGATGTIGADVVGYCCVAHGPILSCVGHAWPVP